jgi:hypothetical protein
MKPSKQQNAVIAQFTPVAVETKLTIGGKVM